MNNLTPHPRCVLVTGANGFVGSHVVDELLKNGYQVKAVVRSEWKNVPQGVEIIHADLSVPVDWSAALRGVTTIIHSAARVHQMAESSKMGVDEHRNHNTRATLELAEQAAKADVQRFIYISTIAINGVFTNLGQYFSESSEPNPQSSYASSKYEAELGLAKVAHRYPIEIVTIRPPMVYGANAPGNFSRLVSLVKTRIPLPFGLADNPRSFIFVNNLVNFIMLCIDHPGAGNQLFLVSDGEDVSLRSMICQISDHLQLKSCEFPFPLSLLKSIFFLLGRSELSNQLLKSMRVDISKARKLLGWVPPYSSSDGLAISLKNTNDIKRVA